MAPAHQLPCSQRLPARGSRCEGHTCEAGHQSIGGCLEGQAAWRAPGKQLNQQQAQQQQLALNAAAVAKCMHQWLTMTSAACGAHPKSDRWAVSLPHASPGSTGSIRPHRPAAAVCMCAQTASIELLQKHCSRLGCWVTRPVGSKQHCVACGGSTAVAAPTCDGIQVRHRRSLEWRAVAKGGDGHVADAIHQHKGPAGGSGGGARHRRQTAAASADATVALQARSHARSRCYKSQYDTHRRSGSPGAPGAELMSTGPAQAGV